MNDIDDYPVIPNFDEQVKFIDKLAKDFGPTRNKGNVTSFMEAVEAAFKLKGWSFTNYCKKVSIDGYDRKHTKRVKSSDTPLGELTESLKTS